MSGIFETLGISGTAAGGGGGGGLSGGALTGGGATGSNATLISAPMTSGAIPGAAPSSGLLATPGLGGGFSGGLTSGLIPGGQGGLLFGPTLSSGGNLGILGTLASGSIESLKNALAYPFQNPKNFADTITTGGAAAQVIKDLVSPGGGATGVAGGRTGSETLNAPTFSTASPRPARPEYSPAERLAMAMRSAGR
jgi:hypothetical protein